MAPEAILFDLDDTLADRAAGLRKYASCVASEFEEALHPIALNGVHAAILAADDFGSMRQAEALCAAPIWRTPPDPVVLFEHWAVRFGAAAVAFPGVIDLLRSLQLRGIKTGIVTNGGSEMQRSKMTALGLEPFMNTIVISSEVGLHKPDPAIFRLALERLACRAENAWFVGDHPDFDVRGAATAGLRAFLVKTGSTPNPEEPYAHLANISELMTYVMESEGGSGSGR